MVDLPEPDGPMSATNSPGRTSRSAPRRAWTMLSFPMRYVFVTPRSWMTGADVVAGDGRDRAQLELHDVGLADRPVQDEGTGVREDDEPRGPVRRHVLAHLRVDRADHAGHARLDRRAVEVGLRRGVGRLRV